MATPISMPRQGQSVETCIISSWNVRKGDKVSEGDILLSYETDKASFELEAPVPGTLLDVFYQEGDEVPVLENIAVIGDPGEETGEYRPPGAKTDKTKTADQPERQTKQGTKEKKGKTGEELPGEKKRISPRARNMAEKLHVDTSLITGSGPYGRIIAADIDRAASDRQSMEAAEEPAPAQQAGKPGEQEYVDNQLSNLRRIVAERMHASLQNSAQLTHHISADARKILGYRQSFKSLAEGSANKGITINDMICYAVVRVLKEKKYMNAHFLGDRIRIYNKVHLGIAVDTPRGLMVPVLKNASDLTLTETSLRLKALADDCKTGNIDPELLQSEQASFTVTNLGSYGIEMFTPVLNLPQAGILGVNTIQKKPVDLGQGTLGMVPHIGLSLTYDHRVVDGAPASSFLSSLKEYVESFELEIG